MEGITPGDEAARERGLSETAQEFLHMMDLTAFRELAPNDELNVGVIPPDDRPVPPRENAAAPEEATVAEPVVATATAEEGSNRINEILGRVRSIEEEFNRRVQETALKMQGVDAPDLRTDVYQKLAQASQELQELLQEADATSREGKENVAIAQQRWERILALHEQRLEALGRYEKEVDQITGGE